MSFRHRAARLLCAGALVFLFAAAPAAAIPPPGTLYVAPAGVDTGLCTDLGSPCATITYALSVAGQHDEIQLAAGTYAEQVRAGGHTILGAGIGKSIIVPPADLGTMETAPSPGGGTTAPIVMTGGGQDEQGDDSLQIVGVTIDGQDRTACSVGDERSISLTGILTQDADLTVDRVRILGLQPAAGSTGCADDAPIDGIVASDLGGGHRVHITDTVVERYRRTGIGVFGPPSPTANPTTVSVGAVTIDGSAESDGSAAQTGIRLDDVQTEMSTSSVVANVTNIAADGGDDATLDLRRNNVLGGGTGIRVDGGHLTTVSNRIVDNAVGVANGSGHALDIPGNWWGCNAGPGATGCDPLTQTDGAIHASPWLILTLTAATAAPVIHSRDQQVPVEAAMTRLDDGTPAASAPAPGTPIYFGSYEGTMSPALGTLDAGSLQSWFAWYGIGEGAVIRATVDHETQVQPVLTQASPPPDPPTPVNGARPHVTGTAQVSRAVTCHPGTWTPTPSVYETDWLRDGSTIPGAFSRRYVVRPADAGHRLACRVTATTFAQYTSASATATSASVRVPVPEHAVLAPGIAASGFHVNAAGVGELPLQCVGAVGTCTVTGTIATGGAASGRATASRVVVVAHLPTTVIKVGKHKKVRVHLPRSLMTSVSKNATRQVRVAVTMSTTAKAGARTTVTQHTTIHFSRGAQRPAFTG